MARLSLLPIPSIWRLSMTPRSAGLHPMALPGTLMPAFARSAGGTLTDRQIDVLVRQMRTQWAKPDALGGASPPAYWPPLRVTRAAAPAVYQTYCSSCHGPAGKGGGKAHSIVDGSYLALGE